MRTMIHDLPPHRLRWQITQSSIELHADGNRHLAATDSDRRDLLLSCGAALHHLQVALAASTCPYACTGCPIPRTSGHLPTIEILPKPADPADTDSADRVDAALADSIDRRRTEHRRMSHRPVPARHLAALGEQAARLGAGLIPGHRPHPSSSGSLPPSPRATHDQNDTRATKPIGTGAGKAIGW